MLGTVTDNRKSISIIDDMKRYRGVELGKHEASGLVNVRQLNRPLATMFRSLPRFAAILVAIVRSRTKRILSTDGRTRINFW